MAHGLNSVLKRVGCKGEGKAAIGSRRIFAPHFKLQVLDSYRNDADCKGNQRATARKYGIHRRQIQKWLQVEGNLRNSVGKSRLPDDETTAAPAPLDFTTRARTPDPAPMDLSLKRSAPTAPASCRPPSSSPLRLPSPLGLAVTPHPDVWDLSTKPRHEVVVAAPKPIKLFKPYLDDDTPRKPPGLLPPCCTQPFATCDATYYYNNNNNVICDANTYTLHELQPKGTPTTTTTSYYYAFPTTYHELGSYNPGYEDGNYVQSAVPLKQRHSYSLDFKLSAIECYYQDSVCKGNQRAVATKYNIHRRQVQKWLKQADELRQRNETIKHTQMVR